MAYAGALSADGTHIAYNPLAPAFGFNFNAYTAWGNYHGGRAGEIWIASLPGLEREAVPHERAADFSPVYLGGQVYFLSGRKGAVSVFRYDPGSKSVSEVYHNTGPDIRSLASDGATLVFDRLGTLYTLQPGSEPVEVKVEVDGDMPEVRPHFKKVSSEVENISLSPTGARVAVEAHGDILTVPGKHGPVRNITGTPGTMERDPAWSPDGKSIAYFAEDGGVYGLHVSPQTGEAAVGAAPVRTYALAPGAAYYFSPVWSPDSKRIAFYDNRLKSYVLDLATGKLTTLGEPDVYGGFSLATHAMAWSPDSKWLVYPHSSPNRLHVLMLYGVETGSITQITDAMADAHDPAFDRNGRYLYFAASNNAGAVQHYLDMTSDLYRPTSALYAMTLRAGEASPLAPQSDDEKTPQEMKEKAKANADLTPAGRGGEKDADKPSGAGDEKSAEAKRKGEGERGGEGEGEAGSKERAGAAAPRVLTDLPGLSLDAMAARTVALPVPPASITDLIPGKPGNLYYIVRPAAPGEGPAPGGLLNRFSLEERKSDKLAENVEAYQVSADGKKILLALVKAGPRGAGGEAAQPDYVIVNATEPLKPDEGRLDLSGLEVKVDPKAEWAQMFHEVWRIERAYFYDPNLHGVDAAAEEKRLEPYVEAIQSRADLNYLFQEMLTGFSVGHLRGIGGAVPEAPKVPGGLLGADYVITNNRWCLAKIYTGGSWSPDVKAPLAQPGLNIRVGDCIIAVDGTPVRGDEDIQRALEATAGKQVLLRLQSPGSPAVRDVVVEPVASEAKLRNLDWIDANQKKVDALSGGQLAYVYLPDTGQGGFTSFNRYFFAQTNKKGVVIDERFNAGGQVADYIVEVLGRHIESYWSPRYGAVEHTPAGAIYGPKVMIANEVSGSGGDALPWLFKHNSLGPLVGKRTWGGLVGIGPIPVLMDGGRVTSPSVAFFSPKGEWDVENHGVDPDFPVEQDPKAVAEGHDPQLETAVAVALEALKKAPPPETPPRPAYPNYHATP